MPDWKSVLRTVFVSRALDALEETRLVPERKVLYQFCARGHDVTQALLGQRLTERWDAVTPYYRSRPLALALGLPAEEALASTMMRAEGMSGGRDIGVVINRPNREGPCLLPACGGVGAQFTPATGWAQALVYRERLLKDGSVAGSIAVAHGGEASTSTNGFWASLNIATTSRLPLLYFIEDNGYGISVPATRQTPGGDIAANLAAFRNLKILTGDGADPFAASMLIDEAVAAVRSGGGPVLLRLRVPRLSGHSGQDTQAYKSAEEIAAERARDPLLALRRRLVPGELSEGAWQALEAECESLVQAALERIEARPPLATAGVARHVFTERGDDGKPELQAQGGQWRDGAMPPAGTPTPRPEGARINMLTAIRRTLEHELATNPRVLVFGEDVGVKGGVHAATLGLQERFGEDRVFDTSLSEKASSAGPLAWRSQGSCRCRKSSSASTPNPRRSSCTTAAPCAGGR
jgi:2-oxoisovalerate dehydrogenase E1 component